MNDEFLKALRRDPPPQFARRLKRQLDAQPQRRTWSLPVRTLFFLVVGAAFAGGMFVLEKRSSTDSEVAQPQPQIDAASPAAPGYRPRALGPGFVPQGNDTARGNFDNSQPSADSPAPPGLPAQPGPTPADPTVAAPSTPEQSTRSGPFQSGPAPGIATSPLTEALVRSVLNDRSNRSDVAPRIQTMEADAAFAGLCAPGSARQFELVVTSRRIARAEFAACRRNGVDRIIESKLGYQALVLTSARDSAPMKLSASDVHLALAKQIPDPLDPARFIENNNVTWDQVDPDLQYRPIALFGPARATPLHRIFEAVLLEPGCDAQQAIERLRVTDPDLHADLCRTVRGDRLYSEVEQTASLIPQNLWAVPHAFVLVDYDFYRDNRAQLAASALEGPEPSPATFADGTYPLARPVYLYVDWRRVSITAYRVMRDLQSLERFPPRGGSGFVRLDEQDAKKQQSRGSEPLSESDLAPDRSPSR